MFLLVAISSIRKNYNRIFFKWIKPEIKQRKTVFLFSHNDKQPMWKPFLTVKTEADSLQWHHKQWGVHSNSEQHVRCHHCQLQIDERAVMQEGLNQTAAMQQTEGKHSNEGKAWGYSEPH